MVVSSDEAGLSVPAGSPLPPAESMGLMVSKPNIIFQAVLEMSCGWQCFQM